MARGRFLWDKDEQEWLPRHEVLARRLAAKPDSRSALGAPLVLGSMPEIRSPIDGQIYSTKGEYYRHVERNGCAIVGFDKNWQDQITAPRYDERKHEADVVADVKKSIEMVSSGNVEPENAA
jgi:hypothetical protein